LPDAPDGLPFEAAIRLRRFLTIACALLAVGATMFARTGGRSAAQPEKKVVDLKADVMYPIDFRDTSAVCLVGNVAFYHSGAVITCDSAVRYSERHMECFGNVLINKNDTYVYGDRADYNGETHVANVYSDLVKVVDGEATLYTYKFLFNTQTDVGQYAGGGAVTSRGNLLESDRGYYYADQRRVICVDRVEIRSEEYDLKGDSVVYDLSTDRAYYYRHTNIWNAQGDYLYADCGEYDKSRELYTVTENGYILTDKQEVWSDSIDYFKPEGYVVLRGGIQIDDTEHKVLAFGEFGQYWKEPGNAFLTRRPVVVSYDTSQGDSLFMAADSMYLFTIDPARQRADSLRAAALHADSLANGRSDSLSADSPARGGGDSLRRAGRRPKPAAPSRDASAPNTAEGAAAPRGDTPVQAADSLRGEPAAADSLRTDSLALDSLQHDTTVMTKAQRRQLLREAAARRKAELKAKRAAERQAELDTIAARRLAKTRAKLDAQRLKDSLRDARLAAKRAEKTARRRAERGVPEGAGSAAADSLAHLAADSLAADSLSQAAPADSLAHAVPADSLVRDSLAADSLARDSVYRLVKGFRNVRIYRSDFQSVCDSLVAVSRDSTIHLYIDPVLWNQNSQVTSDVMDIYTAGGRIERAEFVGRPLMISELDTMHYNQVAGKTMTALFRDNQIYRNDVKGNAQTIYFMQEDGAPDIIGLLVLESGDMTFYIEQKQVVGITYRNNPVYTIYPMDKIPPDVALFLKDFKWEAARRPARREVFDRTIRPSVRAHKSRLPRPHFPIAARIDAYRQQLVESRRWSDRDDTVQPDVLDWMQSLGWRPPQRQEGVQ